MSNAGWIQLEISCPDLDDMTDAVDNVDHDMIDWTGIEYAAQRAAALVDGGPIITAFFGTSTTQFWRCRVSKVQGINRENHDLDRICDKAALAAEEEFERQKTVIVDENQRYSDMMAD